MIEARATPNPFGPTVHEHVVAEEIEEESPLEREWRTALAGVAVAISKLTEAHSNLMRSRDLDDRVVVGLRYEVARLEEEVEYLRSRFSEIREYVLDLLPVQEETDDPIYPE